jgi:glycosyltransferase involved in cell wall biosynthesis
MPDNNGPLVSILLPTFNAEKYIGKAIDSILQQTFTDFELIIINDGSLDGTGKIVESYKDPRIIYRKHQTNRGLIYTLNSLLSLARGKYIARMDGDDISGPERIEKQLDYLEKNQQVDVLATQVRLIDEVGNNLGDWDDDIKHSTASSIRRFLPINNCIAHPTIIAKRELLLTYKYKSRQKLSEDYDLWLRVAADGKVIDKIPLRLLDHRILASSFTRTRRVNVFFKMLVVKWIFVKDQLQEGKFNKFILRTFLYMVVDGIKGTGKVVKQILNGASNRRSVEK